MKATEFCYWLQGLFELGNPKSLTVEQTQIIKNHLNMVFYQDIDRSYPSEQQTDLNTIPQTAKKTKTKGPVSISALHDILLRC